MLDTVTRQGRRPLGAFAAPPPGVWGISATVTAGTGAALVADRQAGGGCRLRCEYLVPKGNSFETQHRPHDAFDRSMVLFDDVVEVFALA